MPETTVTPKYFHSFTNSKDLPFRTRSEIFSFDSIFHLPRQDFLLRFIFDSIFFAFSRKKDLKGTSIVFTPTNHYSRRGLLDENVALWGSFAVLGKHGNRFWFGGDTAYCEVFKQIGKKFGPFQLSAIPIGSYAPRAALKYNHIDPDEAVKVHCDIRSEMSIGIHWGTFKTNATEFYLEPKYKIDQARLEFGKTPEGEDKLQFYTIPIGETREGKSVTLQNLS